MAQLIVLTHGRAWAARLLVLLPVMALIAVVIAVVPASADHLNGEGGGTTTHGVHPIRVAGNPDCGDIGSTSEHSVKFDNPTDGGHTDLATGVVFNLTIPSEDPGEGEGPSFDFEIEGGAALDVIVKGGPDANHYPYESTVGPVTSDTFLHAPVNPRNNKFHSLSHIEFCYDELHTISGTKSEVEFDGETEVTDDPRVEGRAIFLFDSSEELVDATTTDTDGFYEFTDVVPGTYTVCEEQDPDTEFQADPQESLDPEGPAECAGLDAGEEITLAPRGHVVTVGPDSTGNDFANIIAAEGGVIVRAECDVTENADVTSNGETIENTVKPLCDEGTQGLLLEPAEVNGQVGVRLKFVMGELAPVEWSTIFPDEAAPDLDPGDAQIPAIFYLEDPGDDPVSLPWCEFHNGVPTPPENFFACEVEQSGVLVGDGTIRVADTAIVTGDPFKLR